MGNFLDRLSVYVLLFLGVLVAARIAKLPLWLCFGAALCVAVLAALAVRCVTKNERRLSYRDFATYCMLEGEDCVRALLQSLAGERYADCGQWLYVDGKIVFLWVKFGGLSADSAANIYRVCRDHKLEKAYLLTAAKDRKNIAMMRRFCKSYIVFIDLKTLYNALKKRGKLPAVKPHRLPLPETAKLAFAGAFTKKNGVRLLIAAAVLVGASFLTPLTTYYLTLAGITLALSAVCLFAKQ